MRRILAVAIVVAVVALLIAPMAGRAIGQWLIVDDPPQPARAIVVLGGHLPFRAMEGAAAYREGLAKEVWLTQGRVDVEDVALERLKIRQIEEHEYSQQVLQAQGVPAAAIQVLPERNLNTADEIRSVARHLTEAGGGRVIIVTSKYHTRRVKLLWRLLAEGQGEALVRFTPEDPFDPDGWWRTTGDAMAVAREYFGMLNAWAGFPLTSER
jgi:uncharacterized SAM-binding protein YcdF (DUF218 family)